MFESLFLIFEPLPLNVASFNVATSLSAESAADGVAVPMLLLRPLGERACLAAVLKSSREGIAARDSFGSSKKTATGFIKFACKHKTSSRIGSCCQHLPSLRAYCSLVIVKPLAWMDIYDRSAR